MNMLASKKTLASFAVALACATGLGALVATRATTSNAPLELSVQVYDDLMHVVDGEVVAVESGTTTFAQQTELDGSTPVFDLLQGQTVRVSLDETTTEKGLCLGQTHTLTLPFATYPNATELAYTRAFFQPVLTPVSLSNRDVAYARPYHTRWMTFPSSNPTGTLRFQAGVGMLLSATEITAFEDYYQVQFGPSSADYELGVVIRCVRTDIGTGNLMMSIDCRGHGFSAMPDAATFVVASADPNQPPPTFAATPIYWDQGTQRLLVDLSGTLERGMNIILIADTPLGDEAIRLTSNPNQPVAAAMAAGGGSDCTPPKPGAPAGWTCSPAPPGQCGGATSIASNCSTTTNPSGTAVCGGSGESRTKEEHTEWKGSVSVEIGLPGGGTAGATGEVSYSSSSSWTVDFQGGDNGCGQCCQMFTHVLICGTRWNAQADRYLNLEHVYRFPCDQDVQVSTTCTDTQSSSGCCSRTCN
jgi:hypothetical protein